MRSIAARMLGGRGARAALAGRLCVRTLSRGPLFVRRRVRRYVRSGMVLRRWRYVEPRPALSGSALVPRGFGGASSRRRGLLRAVRRKRGRRRDERRRMPARIVLRRRREEGVSRGDVRKRYALGVARLHRQVPRLGLDVRRGSARASALPQRLFLHRRCRSAQPLPGRPFRELRRPRECELRRRGARRFLYAGRERGGHGDAVPGGTVERSAEIILSRALEPPRRPSTSRRASSSRPRGTRGDATSATRAATRARSSQVRLEAGSHDACLQWPMRAWMVVPRKLLVGPGKVLRRRCVRRGWQCRVAVLPGRLRGTAAVVAGLLRDRRLAGLQKYPATVRTRHAVFPRRPTRMRRRHIRVWNGRRVQRARRGGLVRPDAAGPLYARRRRAAGTVSSWLVRQQHATDDGGMRRAVRAGPLLSPRDRERDAIPVSCRSARRRRIFPSQRDISTNTPPPRRRRQDAAARTPATRHFFAGTYGNVTGLTTDACSAACFPGATDAPAACAPSICEEGFWCPPGSTHGRMRECGENHYCPSGATAPLPVDATMVGVGGGGPTTRSGQASCPDCCPDGVPRCAAPREELYRQFYE